jgi:hypothetical protein
MRYASLAMLLVFTGCSHFQDELSPSRICYAPKYKESVKSLVCQDNSIYYEYKVRLIGFTQVPFKFAFYTKRINPSDTLIYDTPGEVESRLLKVLKDKGLYLNDFEYIYDDHDDIYVVVYGSPKPSSKKDWAELNKHYDIIKLKELKNKYPSITNDVPKCECRYCTSGLDRKYWR